MQQRKLELSPLSNTINSLQDALNAVANTAYLPPDTRYHTYSSASIRRISKLIEKDKAGLVFHHH